MSLYNDEGVADVVGEVKFQDNQIIIDTISSKSPHSLFGLLDDEGARPGGSSKGFFTKLVKYQTAGIDGRSKNPKSEFVFGTPRSNSFE